jgi:hypothetical protein
MIMAAADKQATAAEAAAAAGKQYRQAHNALPA